MEQRFNVAMSRARDRLYLVRSVAASMLSPRDLKAAVIEHFRNPMGDAAAAQLAEHVVAVLVGEPEVEHDEVGRLGARAGERLEGARGEEDPVPLERERALQGLGVGRRVLDDEDAGGVVHRGVSPPTAAPDRRTAGRSETWFPGRRAARGGSTGRRGRCP